MSKKNVFFSALLLVLSVCFMTDAHALESNTPDENIQPSVMTTDSSRWEAIQPMQKVTSEGLIIDCNFDNLEVSYFIKGTVKVTITIPENYEQDSIVIAPDIFGEIAYHIYYVASEGKIEKENFNLSQSIQPGDDINIQFIINNKSKYTYNYDKTSFEIFPKEDIVYEQVTNEPVVSEEETPLFNDLTVNDNYHFRRAYNTALQVLIPNSSSSEVTDEVIDAALIKAGYNGIADYTQYLLDFYNEKYHTDYTRLDQFPDGIIREILGENDPFATRNSAYIELGIFFSISTDLDDILDELRSHGYDSPEEYILEYYNEKYGTNAERIVDLPEEALDEFFAHQGSESGGNILETNSDLITLSYDFFYNKGLSFGFEDDVVTDDNSEDYSIGEYMRDEAKGDDTIIEHAGTLSPNTDNYNFKGTLYVSGNYLLDAYISYEYHPNLQFTYSALKGTVIAKYVDIYGNVLADDIITKDMVGKNYQTFEKIFDNYVLQKIDGEEYGEYIDGTIVVVYVYVPKEEEPGIGSTDVPEEPTPEQNLEIVPPHTGVETQNENLYLVLILTLCGFASYKVLLDKKNS